MNVCLSEDKHPLLSIPGKEQYACGEEYLEVPNGFPECEESAMPLKYTLDPMGCEMKRHRHRGRGKK
jgi:hypothetical protein